MNSYAKSTFLILIIHTTIFTELLACKGCITLDEHNFSKVIPKFKAVLVKFDIAYPFGEKHDVFTKLAEEMIPINSLVIGEVGVKDYGDKENEILAIKYGIRGKDDFPVVKLFLEDTENYVDFPKNMEFSIENLRNFVRDHADLYIGLPGCLQSYDVLAQQFVSSDSKDVVIKEVEQALDGETVKEVKSSAQIYLLYMNKIQGQGVSFIKQERKRLEKLINSGQVNKGKKDELVLKLNILHSFKANKDEL